MKEKLLKICRENWEFIIPLKIDKAIELGNKLESIQPNTANLFSCGIDPAFGSSAFAIVLTEYIKEENKIRVLSAEQYENHPDPQAMIDRIFDIHRHTGIAGSLLIPVQEDLSRH